ncbi:MAG: hypothetical protein AAFO88_02915 [Pseudomonadota bacterium]
MLSTKYEQREGAGAQPTGWNSAEQQAGGAQGLNPFKTETKRYAAFGPCRGIQNLKSIHRIDFPSLRADRF